MIWNSIYWKTVASCLAQVFPIQCRHLPFWSISSIPQWASENTSNVTGLTTSTTMLKTWFPPSNSLYSCFFSLEEHRMSPAFLSESSPIVWKKKKIHPPPLSKNPLPLAEIFVLSRWLASVLSSGAIFPELHNLSILFPDVYLMLSLRNRVLN